jgi:iron complex outermembrane recepter protein
MKTSARRYRLAAIIGSSTLGLIAGPAFAQSNSSGTPSLPDTTAAPDAEQSDTTGLEEIVVTAQRRSENLQRAAIAVSAVSGDSLLAAGVSDVNNLSKLVPAMVVAQSPGSSINFYIRGVGTFAANILRENPIAFNFNGVYIGSPSAPVGTLYDLERIEVLKGPQGTLYGRNATGGSLNVIPRRPSLDRIGGEGSVEIGNYNSKKVSAAVNLPVGETVALRLATQWVDRDGYLSDGTDDEEGKAFRGTLLVQPNDGFSATIVADYFKAGGEGAGGVLQPGDLTPTVPSQDRRIGASDPRSTAELLRFPLVQQGVVTVPQDDSYNRGEFWGVSATIEGDLGFGTLTAIPAYRKAKPDFRGYTLGYPFVVAEDDDQMTLEVRLASRDSGGPLQYVVGGYLFDENKLGTNSIDQGFISRTSYTVEQDTESYAVFGQASFEVAEGMRVVGGVRQTHETRSQDTQLTQRTRANPNAPTVQITGDLSFDSTTWKGGVELDVAPQSLLYASVSTGFKSGGFYLGLGDNSYQPERLTAYAMGSKNRFFDDRLQLNVEGFYWKYRDQQINYVGPIQTSPGVFGPGGVTANAGDARFYGAEGELQFQLTPSDLFLLDVQYLNSKYDRLSYVQFSAAGAPPRVNCAVSPDASIAVLPPARLFLVDCSGRTGINAPEWSGNIAYEHRFQLGGELSLVAVGRTRLESGRFLAIEYLPEQYQGSYMSSDLMLTLEGPAARWSISAFVNNVEDETIKSGSGGIRPFINVAYTSLRPPRTYGIRGTFRF